MHVRETTDTRLVKGSNIYPGRAPYSPPRVEAPETLAEEVCNNISIDEVVHASNRKPLKLVRHRLVVRQTIQ